SIDTINYGSNQQRYAFLKSMYSSVYRTNQQKYKFFRTQFDNNENLNEHERQYLTNMLQRRFDNLSQNYREWTGNDEIDNVIKEAQKC
ncbi:29537_t:CDS:2, partial [Gigaspora margarita]